LGNEISTIITKRELIASKRLGQGISFHNNLPKEAQVLKVPVSQAA
jgi:hypothetical protein